MRMSKVRVRRYRCIDDLSVEVSDYMVLVGANGSGKSSLLYALDWFFNGVSPSVDDLHSTVATQIAGTTHDEIDVEVTFDDLNAEDRIQLGRYGRGTTAVFRRCWNATDKKEKLLGNSRQGPGFAAMRVGGVKSPEMKERYEAARLVCPTLPSVTTMDKILAALDEWELDPANQDTMEEVEAVDATHMFGIGGEHTLAKRARFVLIPASADLVGQLGTTNRGTALQELIGSLMADAVTSARVKWETENAEKIAALEVAIKEGVQIATKVHSERVNKFLMDFVPKARVDLKAEPPPWTLKGDAKILTDVIIEGERKDVSRQGHGIQRAVMIAMLQARVPDKMSVEAQLLESGLNADEAQTQLTTELAKLPALIIAIEEPEIYQHPVRARHFAKVLGELARRHDTQVVFATHSPYFVLPGQFGALRRFTLSNGKAAVSSSSIGEIAAAADKSEDMVIRTVERELPRTFSEGFFADAVVLVEGETDRVVIETVAELRGKSLGALGIAVLDVGGQGGLRIPREMLVTLGIRVYIIADTDSLGSARNHPDDPTKRANADDTHRNNTNALLEWLPECEVLKGVSPFTYGSETTVTKSWTLFHDNLEHELANWPSFVTNMNKLGSGLSSKNAASYRIAVGLASVTDLPENLEKLVDAISTLG